MAAKTKKPKTVKLKPRAKISAPAEAKPAPYVIPEPAAAPKAEGDTTAFIRQESSRYDGDTSIRLYLREIGQVKLLTPRRKLSWPRASRRATKKRAST